MEDKNTTLGALSHAEPGEIEQDKLVNRVIVFGSYLSGAFDLQAALQEYLERSGIKNPLVQVVRDVALIRAAILDIEGHHQGNRPSHSRESKPTLPRGVIILPEMRQDHGGMGMTIPTFDVVGDSEYSPFNLIAMICDENSVPYIALASNFTKSDFDQKIESLFSSKPALKPGQE